MTPEVRPFYASLLREVLETGFPVHHEYECPSPALDRRFLLHITPLPEGAGLLLHHEQIAVAPHCGPQCEHTRRTYAGASGVIALCCHCRRARRGDDTTEWDWVPGFLESPPRNLSHTFCPSCFERYYPEVAPFRGAARAGARA